MPDFYGKEPEIPDHIETLPQAVHEDKAVLKPQELIGKKEIREAQNILQEYKNSKAHLEDRIIKDELWWKLRHWDTLRKADSEKIGDPEPASAWLFNAILNKHADAMDNYPLPVVLPRERSDEQSASVLTKVLPVIMEYNDFEETYSDNWWEKLKHGTGAYGVFWNPEKENGLGDIDIRELDLLKIFWEPGVRDIQKSANLFIVDLVDRDALDRQYPEHKGEFNGQSIDIAQYVHDDSIDTSGKAVVVDWYYKRRLSNGKTILHYCKFCNDTVLYASENTDAYRERGFYDHGRYPVEFDTLFRDKDTPCGFGYVAICKDPQMYIDKLSQNIMMHSMMATRPRFFVSESTNMSLEEFANWNNPFVHVSGELADTRIKELTIQPLAPIYQNVLDSKINEMKETAANRDISSGGSAGVTAAASIAALQEAGNKVSRDMIASSYRCYVRIVNLCLELIRQFYDEARSFRITGDQPGLYQYESVSNLQLRGQKTGMDMMGNALYRMPVFDLKVKAVRKSPFSRMEENERAKELYSMGFFNPERAQEAVSALEMMDFEGIDGVREKIAQGQTLLNIVQQQQMQMQQMQLQQLLGVPPAQGPQPQQNGMNAFNAAEQGPRAMTPQTTPAQNRADTGERGYGPTDSVMNAKKKSMTPYGKSLAERSRPSIDGFTGKE